MINAQQAKALYDESGAEVNHFLTYEVEKQVIAAAKGEKRTCTILLGSAEVLYRTPEPDPLQKAIIAALIKLGYMAKFVSYGDKYVPRGLADDDGNGPEHQNYGIVIGW